MGWNGSGGDKAPQDDVGRKRANGSVSRLMWPTVVLAIVACVTVFLWRLLSDTRSKASVDKENDEVRFQSSKRAVSGSRGETAGINIAVPLSEKQRTVVQVVAKTQTEEELDTEAEAEVTGAKDLKGINAADQMILMLLAAPPGQEHAPMPVNAVTEEDFDRSLKHEIVLRDNDSTAVRHLKETLIVVRREIQELRKEGRSVNSILQQFHDESNENLNLRIIASREAQEILDKGDADGAREYVTTLNEQFGRMGIDPIEMPLAGEEAEIAEAEAEELAAADAKVEADERADIERRKAEYKESKRKERK